MGFSEALKLLQKQVRGRAVGDLGSMDGAPKGGTVGDDDGDTTSSGIDVDDYLPGGSGTNPDDEEKETHPGEGDDALDEELSADMEMSRKRRERLYGTRR